MSTKRSSNDADLPAAPKTPKRAQLQDVAASTGTQEPDSDSDSDWKKKINFDASLYKYEVPEPPPEKDEIIGDIESGEYILWFEYNTSRQCKCRARTCKVATQTRFRNNEDRIEGLYRFNLRVAQPSRSHWSEFEKPQRRFFHLTCLESVLGPDLVQHVNKPAEHVLRRSSFGTVYGESRPFSTAISEWIRNGAKTLPAADYEAFEKACEQYENDSSLWSMLHQLSCKDGPCACTDPIPIKPKPEDYLSGVQEERSLCDVVLDTMGVQHIMEAAKIPRYKFLMDSYLLQILEQSDNIPEALSKENLPKKLALIDRLTREAQESEQEINRVEHGATEELKANNPAEEDGATI